MKGKIDFNKVEEFARKANLFNKTVSKEDLIKIAKDIVNGVMNPKLPDGASVQKMGFRATKKDGLITLRFFQAEREATFFERVMCLNPSKGFKVEGTKEQLEEMFKK